MESPLASEIRVDERTTELACDIVRSTSPFANYQNGRGTDRAALVHIRYPWNSNGSSNQ